jgi:menaquinol-cytochrome c reductase iron-sulfur subunit
MSGRMPDRRSKVKSKYTADRNIPGAFAGETVTRRRFMTLSVHGAGAVAAGAFVLPALAFALGPVFERTHARWEPIGHPDEFNETQYIPRVFTETPGIGEVGKSTAYIRKHNPSIDGPRKDQYDAFVAISTRCMHLGCPVAYRSAAQRFICPCHGGVYDFLGQRVGGPPVRPLDRFYTRVRNGLVELGPRYSVNSELRRFSPRYPGEIIDGIGQYLYPSRPTIRKLPGT